jgi:hypothetical protein
MTFIRYVRNVSEVAKSANGTPSSSFAHQLDLRAPEIPHRLARSLYVSSQIPRYVIYICTDSRCLPFLALTDMYRELWKALQDSPMAALS